MLIDFVRPLIENPLFVKFGIIGLFFNSIFASVIPFPTEITASALLLAGQSAFLIFAIMSIGSSIGGVLSYKIGCGGNKIFNFLHKRQKKKHHEYGLTLLTRYGWGIILISSWIPILGDIVTIVSGVKKYDFKKFTFAMIIGKTSHVLAIVYFSNIIFNYFRF